MSACTRAKGRQLRSAVPRPQALAMPPTKAESATTPGKSPTPSGLLLKPLRPQSSPPDRVVTTTEPGRSPSSQLALATVNQTPAPPTTKTEATCAHFGAGSATKDTGHTQTAKVCSHIRTWLQDRDRSRFT